MKKFVLTGLGVAVLVLLASCADRPMGHAGDPALLRGLIDGLLAPLAFIASLFTDDIRMYAFPNVGRWYDLGFILGLSAWGGGGSHAVTRFIYVDRKSGRTIEQRDA
ncbi:hypothetical protein [Asticcacaulis sp. AC402]|uniref:hypothetical protein n=1 Tax=Asticcacaulis sp. AC402 TaxID=1282361 RepID=UPI0003C3BC30|nr:hypothetical protein [Asticcacaulis sp. AC402]ESQ74868.1 hypothetical protein ABAC402_11995 [Asticcacaulis sp. AC402]